MPVSTTSTSFSYKPGAAMLPEPIPFQFLDAGDIVVTHIAAVTGVRTVLAPAAFAVSGDGPSKTGRVRALQAWPAADLWLVERRTSAVQPADIRPHEPLPAVQMTRQLDRMALVAQEQASGLSDVGARAVRVPPGEAIEALEPALARAGRVAVFNAVGRLVSSSYAALAQTLAPLIAAVLGPLYKGDPGGNVMAIGSFAALAQMNIPVGTDRIMTTNGAAYLFDPAIDAAYVAANPYTANISANARGFRLDPDQVLRASFFGAKGDYTGDPLTGALGNIATATDNWGPLTAAMEFRPNAALPFGRIILLDSGKYYSSQTLNPRGQASLCGAGPVAGPLPGFQPTWIVTPRNTTCIRIQSNDVGRIGGASTRLSFITFAQAEFGDNLSAHGVHASTQVYLQNCTYTSVAGDGQHIEAYTDGGGPYGEASNWISIDCFAHKVGGNGHLARGADANIGRCVGFWTQTAGLCGVRDEAYFVNRYDQCHLAGYGNGGVQHGGRHWQPVRDSTGQEPGSVTGPNTAWYDRGALAAPSDRFPAWNAGTAYLAKGPVMASGPVMFTGTYIEGGGAYGFAHAPNGTVVGVDMGWTHFTANLGVNGVTGAMPVVSTTGVGFRRTVGGDAAHPAYPAIGDSGEIAALGWRGDGRPVSQRSALLHYQVDSLQIYWDWEASNSYLAWRRLNAVEHFGMLFESAGGLRGGRAAALTQRMVFPGLVMKDRNDASNIAVVELRPAVPATGEWQRGDRILNLNPAPGGVDQWICTQTGAIAEAPWQGGEGLLIGAVRQSDGKAWVVRDRGTLGYTTTAPAGAVDVVDPVTGLTWSPVPQPFVFTAIMLPVAEA